MAIAPIDFGSNLRPSVVSNIKKINEIIAAVNDLDPEFIADLKSDVATLQTNMTQAQNDITGLKTSVNELSTSLSNTLADISKIKTTLYTPLEETE